MHGLNKGFHILTGFAMRRFLICLLSLLYSTLALEAQERSDSATILVLDASGSMWAQLPEGRSRIEVARDVLDDFLSARDPAAPLGMIAYGHNRKGDCSDIETIAPTGPQDGRALGQRLRTLMPRGKTPLADALRRAAAEIPAAAGFSLAEHGSSARGKPLPTAENNSPIFGARTAVL
jgi:hypothetical protein